MLFAKSTGWRLVTKTLATTDGLLSIVSDLFAVGWLVRSLVVQVRLDTCTGKRARAEMVPATELDGQLVTWRSARFLSVLRHFPLSSFHGFYQDSKCTLLCRRIVSGGIPLVVPWSFARLGILGFVGSSQNSRMLFLCLYTKCTTHKCYDAVCCLAIDLCLLG